MRGWVLYMQYNRGSQWRRWDLHIHTPETKKNDQYIGCDIEEKWNNFYKSINDYVGDGSDSRKDIVAIGITDYLSIDNYKKVITDNKLPNSIKEVFPNVEMRIIPNAKKSPVNIHFIFDPQIAESIETRFFNKLTFDAGDRKYSGARAELIELGRQHVSTANDDEAYRLGIDQFVPSLSDINEIFKNDPELREHTIIGVSNSSQDGASGITASISVNLNDGSQLTSIRQAVYRISDFIFSSNENDINYFLGRGVDDEKTVKEKCGSLKPCLHGSDAHTNDKLFEPDRERYCWIKANPTFNGLKQVLYEPEARVKISSLLPESKADYQVIDRVEIINNDFTDVPIVFNDKLTCIIGGKSTGKSLLLHNMASAIDRKQVEKKIRISQINTKEISDICVYWADGTKCCSGEKDDTHRIVYIPQTYLNRLSDENEETTEIDQIIQEIVLLDDNCKTAYIRMNTDIQEFKPELDKKIYDLLQIHAQIAELKNNKSELGTENGIKKEIEKIKLQKDIISKNCKISDEDIRLYDDAIKSVIECEEKIKKIEEEILHIEQLNSLFMSIDIDYAFSDEIMKRIIEAREALFQRASMEWKSMREDIKTVLLMKREENIIQRKNSLLVIERLETQISENDAIGKLSEQLKSEEEKLRVYNELDKQYSLKMQQYNDILNEVSNAFVKFNEFHLSYASIINRNTSNNTDGLEFSVAVPFKTEAFCTSMKGCFDKRSLKGQKEIIDFDEFKVDMLVANKIAKFINLCVEGDLHLIKGQTIENVLRNMLSDWFHTSYNVKMDNDTINEMSPGKKALVLLKLLISLADSKCPILIDQPEDDLDNRSIFDELIPFIREKKKIRQIIIVTHNANVVLGGDAEEIIVANQQGNNAPNMEKRFEYRSGAIEDDSLVFDLNGNVEKGILNEKGIQQHICDILEGGKKAFDLRKHKYSIE